ncbi:MAG: hypothetical protein LUG18_15815 [Candidatus Azobacteroides sp.]|nr:hypothetical protein [Candidatus Azobacteroides sp.]
MHNQTDKFNRTYRYHHMGIPTREVHPNEKYSEKFKMYTSDVEGDFRIQYHRFEEDSPLHPLLKTIPHVALQVDNLLSAIEEYEILLEPYEPIPGYKVAVINDHGIPVELIETSLLPHELWGKVKTQPDLNTGNLSL